MQIIGTCRQNKFYSNYSIRFLNRVLISDIIDA
jgi:hypothetical protein